MTPFSLFSAQMQELIETKATEIDLHNNLTSTIKEVFRDAGCHCKEIRLSTDSFTCISTFSEMSFRELQKINDYFEDYEMSIFTHNTLIAFRFTKINS